MSPFSIVLLTGQETVTENEENILTIMQALISVVDWEGGRVGKGAYSPNKKNKQQLRYYNRAVSKIL